MIQACIIVVYIHVLVVFQSTISEPGWFYICPWYEVFCSVWVLLFTDVTRYWMTCSHESADPLCTFESTFICTAILLLSLDLLPSIAWILTLKIIVRFLKKSVLSLFILWWVKSIYIRWQTLHWCWVYTFRHSVHVTCFLFYWKWRCEFVVVYCVWYFIVFIWF